MLNTEQPRPDQSDSNELDHASQAPVFIFDATNSQYMAGLRAFSGVETMVQNHPELTALLEEFTDGKVVLRGFHRFFKSEVDLNQFIEELQITGIDRSEAVNRHGENLHVVASFVGDTWQLALPYSVEDELDPRPKSATRSVGIITIHDNSDGAIIYYYNDGEKREVYSRVQPSNSKIDMYARDNNMGVVIASNEAGESTGWPNRLKGIVIIEYPFLPREDKSILQKIRNLLT